MAEDLRIPFEEAIAEPVLLQPRWMELSLAQQVVLKALYGVPIDRTHTDDLGWSELDYYWAGQGYGIYDDLGYLLSVSYPTDLVYRPKRYSEGWIIGGRRMGKTDAFSSTIVAYEATLGGHEGYIRPGQEAICFQIAQDMRMARNSLGFIKATLESSPIMKKMIKVTTADTIPLKNGITIAVLPPSVRGVRGYANPCTVMDEVGVWYQDSESANPDYEVYRAVKPGQAQFPEAVVVGISSPWNKAGLLYNYWEAGTDGLKAPLSEKDRYENCLVWHATTAGMGNPLINKRWLKTEQARDPRAFERECLAVFQDSISGFLSPTLLREVTEKGVHERPPVDNFHYVAAMDPAFKRDAFGFAIAHAEDRGIVFDVVRRWEPSSERPLNPMAILEEIAAFCKLYNISTVYTDQYQMESLQQIAMGMNFGLEGIPFTSTSKNAIYGNLLQLLNTKRLVLLDEAISLRELRTLERTLTPMGLVNIQAPRGMHDDLATVIAICADKGLWLLPDKPEEKPKEPTIHERIMAQLERQKQEATYSPWD